MKYSYYPGCTLRTKAKDLDAYARASAKALGFELEEIENWQCCGGVYPLGSDEIATKLSSVRALNEAKEKGQDLVTLCSACHHVIKRVNDDMRNVEDIRTRANNYMQLDEPYAGETNVLHYLEVLRDRVGFDELKKKVVNPLKGRKIGAYYGCLLLRPSTVLAFDDPENPQIIEDFIRAIGAEPVVYPYRNECCGGYISLKEKEMSGRMSCNIVDSAAGAGAEMLITACPLCMYNQQERQRQDPGVLLHRASRRGPWRERGGVKVSISKQAEQIREISGVNPYKCMKCGKCSASCPSFNEMDIKPHQFVSYVLNDDIESLVNSKSLWKCLSCFACIERCPRDVKPGKLIDAARQLVVRQRGEAYLTPDEIPELLDPDLPQQLLVSAFRRYRR
jgi:heterodisulfide reductase subunit B